jgi:hypothetical protein
MSAEQEKIRVVAFKDGDAWVAQCLEYDIGAQGTDLDDVFGRLLIAVQIDRETSVSIHGAPFAGINKAPQYFFDKWDQSSKQLAPTVKIIDHTQVEFRLAA